jgi:hypothetical protein
VNKHFNSEDVMGLSERGGEGKGRCFRGSMWSRNKGLWVKEGLRDYRVTNGEIDQIYRESVGTAKKTGNIEIRHWCWYLDWLRRGTHGRIQALKKFDTKTGRIWISVANGRVQTRVKIRSVIHSLWMRPSSLS